MDHSLQNRLFLGTKSYPSQNDPTAAAVFNSERASFSAIQAFKVSERLLAITWGNFMSLEAEKGRNRGEGRRM
ncbi:hypothetical protein R1flu_019126 [Riccia fluitans]|uniref:Uncharacterized protein n=1 Tax=Riccia fluitans TaxID=41844 RepID=A0ABD1ZHS4_9MARC